MYNDLISLTSKAREAYHEMVDALAKEIAEYGGALKGSCGLYFSHLGHSRTPSGCSAISFTSSILSEPLPEVVKQDHTSSNNNNNSTNGQCTGNTTSNYNKQISITSSNASASFEQVFYISYHYLIINTMLLQPCLACTVFLEIFARPLTMYISCLLLF